MGFFTYVFLGGLTLYGAHKIRKSNEEKQMKEEREKQEENKRKSSVYYFDEGLSKKGFDEIVFSCAKKIKRIENVEINGLEIYVTVSSVSGISSWNFILDFNDYGKLTGKCYAKSENNDSDIPERLNDLIYKKLEPYINSIKEKGRNQKKSTRQDSAKKERRKSNWVIVFFCGCYYTLHSILSIWLIDRY